VQRHRSHPGIRSSVTMANVTTDDLLVASDRLQANDLNISSG
jgi:hypothetical protein